MVSSGHLRTDYTVTAYIETYTPIMPWASSFGLNHGGLGRMVLLPALRSVKDNWKLEKFILLFFLPQA